MTTLQLYRFQFKLKLTEDRPISPLNKLTKSLKCCGIMCQRMGLAYSCCCFPGHCQQADCTRLIALRCEVTLRGRAATSGGRAGSAGDSPVCSLA